MSKKQPLNHKGQPKSSSTGRDKSTRRTLGKLVNFVGRIPTSVVYLLLMVVMGSVIYGDVLYIAEQSSFLSFEEGSMRYLLQQQFGPLFWVARLLLLSCHNPWIGGIAWAASLWLVAITVNYALGLKRYWNLIGYASATGIAAYIVWMGLDPMYSRDAGWMFLLQVTALILFGIPALIRLGISLSRKTTVLDIPTDVRRHQNGINSLAVLVMWAGLVTFACTWQQNALLTCTMQRQMEQRDWAGMLETAQRSSQPTRNIAAYHAIALMQTGQIAEKLFDIRYHYADIHMHSYSGTPDGGSAYFTPDCSFYAGMTFPAYHAAMERLEMMGPSVYLMKILARSAMMNDEMELARKYTHIIGKVPFESDFVEEMERYMDDPERITNDPMLATITSLMPIHNTFEQNYRQPTFMGYNLALTEGRSMLALNASIAACLYTKAMPEFLTRLQPLYGSKGLPSMVREAIIQQSIKHPELKQMFPGDPIAETRFQQFLNDVKPYIGHLKDGRETLAPKYKGYFPYYYYFENLPEDTPKPEEKMEGGVN